ncbi:MAG: porin family protein [Candidatus Cloacimonetes bacterium]|nr:porin family protein [Candidatus Cloacimonadota bacterium]
MKNIILLIIALTMCVGALFAQTQFGILPTVGFQAGLNFCNVKQTMEATDENDNHFDVDVTTDPKLAFHIGALMQLPLANNIIIQPELMYSIKGYKTPNNEYFKGMSYHYVQIPILCKYSVEIPDIKIQPYLGPNVGFLFIAWQETKNKNDFWDWTLEDDYFSYARDYRNSLEIGLSVGADAVIMNNIMVGLRYELGLTNTFKKEYGNEKNRVIMLNLGYLIQP